VVADGGVCLLNEDWFNFYRHNRYYKNNQDNIWMFPYFDLIYLMIDST
jgi:hypothetical protein